jgi:hypothetical protein
MLTNSQYNIFKKSIFYNMDISPFNISINETVIDNNYLILRELVQYRNLNPAIQNKNLIQKRLETMISKNETNQSESFMVILVQVHYRIEYFKEMINSLKNVKYIEESLVIFSHDFYDDKINSLVEAIDFCATLQIFYPYSIQLHPSEFPGPSKNDCPRNMPKNELINAS